MDEKRLTLGVKRGHGSESDSRASPAYEYAEWPKTSGFKAYFKLQEMYLNWYFDSFDLIQKYVCAL